MGGRSLDLYINQHSDKTLQSEPLQNACAFIVNHFELIIKRRTCLIKVIKTVCKYAELKINK